MRISFLKILRIGCLSTTSLFFFASLTYAAAQSQRLLPFEVISARADSSIMDFHAVVITEHEQQYATILYNLVQELHALPVGKKYAYYRQILEQRGYSILSNYNDNQHWDFVLEKMNRNLRLTITYNTETGKSTTITASGPRMAEVPLKRCVRD